MPYTSAVYSPSNPRIRKLTDEQRREAVALYDQGWTYKDIADRFGVSASGIVYHVTRRTVLHRDRDENGKAARVATSPGGRGRGKTTPEQRAEAARRVRAGETHRAVADSLGVTPAAVAYYVRSAT